MRPRIFDSHLHIIDPRFPLVENNGFMPDAFTAEDYAVSLHDMEIESLGGAIVSGSFQAFDQTYLLNALERLGPKYAGVTQLPASYTDQEIQDLNTHGVRAVRFNLKRGGSESVGHLEATAKRVFDLAGWHVELYADSRDLPDLTPCLLRLPRVSIDHLGLSKEGLPTLLRLVEKGIRVKATGFGRLNFPAPEALKAIHSANPHALMFGTDLPSTRAPRPFEVSDISLIIETLGQDAADAVFSENALEFYKIARDAN
jgi:predicted TIM-barrel fold metal-dependent hydrolase